MGERNQEEGSGLQSLPSSWRTISFFGKRGGGKVEERNTAMRTLEKRYSLP